MKDLDLIAQLVSSITEGHFDETSDVDMTGIIGEIVVKLNQTLGNLQVMDESLHENADQAPMIRTEVEEVIRTTEKATVKVLDSAEDILNQSADITTAIEGLESGTKEKIAQHISKIDLAAFEIINAQDFQDVTQQRISRAMSMLTTIEQRLLDLLILFKIQEKGMLKSTEDSVDVKKEFSPSSKQDLVDQLLGEFGI